MDTHHIKTFKEPLSSFYTKEMINIQLHAFIILWMILALIWPKKGLMYYIKFGNAPLTFLVVFVATLIIYSYLNLIFGHREISPDTPYPWVGHHESNSPYGRITHFILYEFVTSLISTLLFIFPLIPVLLIGAGVSGLSIQESLKAISILFMTSLLCFTFGSFTDRVFKERRLTGFFITRLFFVCLLVGTGFLGAYLNPVLLIYGMNKGIEMNVGSSVSSYMFYMAITILTAGVLTIANHIILRMQKGLRFRVHGLREKIQKNKELTN